MRLMVYTFLGAVAGAGIALVMGFDQKQLAATAFFCSLAVYAFYREFSRRKDDDEDDMVKED